MRTSSLALAAAGLLGASALACAQSQQSDSSSSIQSPAARQDSSQAQTRQLLPAQSDRGPTTEQESMRDSGSGMTGGMSMQNRSPRDGSMSSGGDMPPSVGGDDAIRVQQQSQNGVAYMCGGIGADEASYMKQQASQYDLMLTFSTRAGNYLADVNVDLTDNRGNPVLRTTCDAPILLVNLPRSGTYHVQAQAGDYNLSKTVSVNARGHTRQVVMAWAQEPYMPAPASRLPARFRSMGGGGIGSGAGSGADDMSRPQRQ